MIIKKCIKCGNQFAYKEKFLSSFPKYRSIKCKDCGAKYMVSEFSRLLFAILIALPLFIRTFLPGVFLYGLIYLLLSIVYLAILLFTYPYFALLKLEEVKVTEVGK